MGIYVAKASAIRDLLIKHFPEVALCGSIVLQEHDASGTKH